MPGTAAEAHQRRWTWRQPLALLVGITVLGVGAAVRTDDSLERVMGGGVLRIGYAVEAPYAFVGAHGEVTGESPEVARHVTRTLGITRVQWVQTRFHQLIPELLGGRFDVVASGLFVTPERERLVAFSLATCRVGPGLLVPADRAEVPASCRTAAQADDLRVAVVEGAVEHGRLRACGVPPERLMVVPDATAGLAAVTSGLAGALALSAPTLRWMSASAAPARTRVSPLAMDEQLSHSAFAFRTEDRALRAAWDNALRGWLGSEEHLRLVGRFGFGPADLPPPLMVASGEAP